MWSMINPNVAGASSIAPRSEEATVVTELAMPARSSSRATYCAIRTCGGVAVIRSASCSSRWKMAPSRITNPADLRHRGVGDRQRGRWGRPRLVTVLVRRPMLFLERFPMAPILCTVGQTRRSSMDLSLYESTFCVEDSHWWFAGRRALVFDELRRVLNHPLARPRILDVGCGTGRNLVVLRVIGEPVGLTSSGERGTSLGGGKCGSWCKEPPRAYRFGLTLSTRL